MHVLGSSVRPVWYGVRGGRRPGAGAGGVLQGSYRVAPPAPARFYQVRERLPWRTYPGEPHRLPPQPRPALGAATL